MMLIIRMLPSDPSKDGTHVFRVFGNLSSFEGTDVERHDHVTHGLIDNKVEAPPSLEFMQEWVDEMTNPYQYKLSDIIWSSYFKINERLANGFRRKNAFLIGGNVYLIFRLSFFFLIIVYFRFCSLPFTSWWTRNELGFTRW